MSLPRLHVVTDDAVVGRPEFLDAAGALLAAHGGALALHVRAPEASARRLLAVAAALVAAAGASGAVVLVNDRIDVAVAAGAGGVHLRERSIPPADARPLLGGLLLGRSVHAVAGLDAVARWTDFLFLGTIYPTATHPGRAPLGAGALTEAAAATDRPVLAIGGIDVGRVADVRAAGAYGVAVLRGVWQAADPVERAGRYLREIGA